MTLQDLNFALKLAADEGWNPGTHDAEPFFLADPRGFFIGILNDDPIGCISAVSYQGTFGFIGLYIILPQYRHQGYGLKLWNAAMSYLANHANIGLDGVISQQDNYRKSGFKLVHRNSRYCRSHTSIDLPTPQLTPISAIPFAEIEAFDHQILGYNRQAFLHSWLQMPNARGLGYYQDNKLQGYGVIRRCLEGYKIGPLFASSQEVAQHLYVGLCAPLQVNELVYLDVCEMNSSAIALANNFQMTKVFETARMYTNPPAELNMSRVFGITTFELG